ncbi:GGDEF domain-containing protein [Paenibacillus sacheonensis]|uniref:Diguanylate cyclase n=1 Tax=Paenibacillus sacheonensis TaxID=742054 RepID=A0A7X4YTP7_9BACL|nr:GGDEF domain-containing protein [Paenibacillus sacheonensis]MBM7567573.1 diguanylate cyclase (GGDEF)-like protein [Paenibacillus sacheonensis]NBC71324.1 diguanylate cyclase [Paenibacillus sacheonensis]
MIGTQKKDRMLEMLFSFVRWFFLLASVWMYYGYYDSPATHAFFLAAFCLSTLYMGATQYVLYKNQTERKQYIYITRAGILFDLCALTVLLILTGYAGSPVFPIGYLIILHASVYWGMKGAVVTSAALIADYAFLVGAKGHVLPEQELPYIVMNFTFLAFIGTLGGMIVARERKHLGEKNEYESMAKRDYLTGLWNHRTFQEHLKQYGEQSRPIAVIMADIDKFKRINDSYGHLTGDLVLRELAVELGRIFCGDNGSVYRYGGEEFAILIPPTEIGAAESRLNLLRDALSAKTFEAGEGVRFTVTMSFGAAIRTGQAVPDLLREADDALYEAKRGGRDRIVWARAAAVN